MGMIRVFRIGKPVIVEHFGPCITKEEFDFNWDLRIAPKLVGYPHIVSMAIIGSSGDYIAYTDEEWNRK